jgi:putative transposase
VEETAEIIVAKLLEYRERGNYLLHDFVLMPNHLHLILTSGHCTSLEKAMQLITGGSSFEIHKVRGQKLQIWQSGFHESRVTSWTDYKKKKDYIDFNPVAAKLVERPDSWVYGSASGKYKVDPIPQGLKPVFSQLSNVGPKGPTPGALTELSRTPGQEPNVAGSSNVGAKAPTPGALTEASGKQGLKPLAPKERHS